VNDQLHVKHWSEISDNSITSYNQPFLKRQKEWLWRWMMQESLNSVEECVS